jgi:hypothetical protein
VSKYLIVIFLLLFSCQGEYDNLILYDKDGNAYILKHTSIADNRYEVSRVREKPLFKEPENESK